MTMLVLIKTWLRFKLFLVVQWHCPSLWRKTQIYAANECNGYVCQLAHSNSKLIKNHKHCNGKCSEILNNSERTDGI